MSRYIEHAQAFRAGINTAGALLTDEQAITVPAIFMPWRHTKPDGTPETYAVGDRRIQDGILYKCLQAHTAQADWTPDVAVSLWARIPNPAEEWPAWMPYAGTVLWNNGDKCSHVGRRWISNRDDNIWEPGTPDSGWEEQL